MPEHPCLGWVMASKTEADAADEWQVMVARCVKRLGKPPVNVLAGRTAATLLMRVVPPGCALRVAVNMHPLQALLEVEE